MANQPKYILELIKTYTIAQQKLINIISQKLERDNNIVYQKKIISQTNEVLEGLLNDSVIWTNVNLPSQYKKGVERVVADYKAMGLEALTFDDFSKLHTKQINILIENTVDNFTTATNFVGRTINDTVREISINSVKQATITGGTIKSIRSDLIQKFIDNNVTSMQTKNGRRISLDAYASTVARSTTRESQNLAQINHMTYQNKDLVQMSSHATTCPICAPLQGRVYSISGNSSVYPPLDIAYTGEHANIHPNCRHVLTPYEPELDENRLENISSSNRPFDIDPRSQQQIDNYNNEQKNNRLRNADKKQWERYKTVMPSDTPKTLSGFRRSKKANSEKYQELQSNYRSIRQS